jgi:hypothetical protein
MGKGFWLTLIGSVVKIVGSILEQAGQEKRIAKAVSAKKSLTDTMESDSNPNPS